MKAKSTEHIVTTLNDPLVEKKMKCIDLSESITEILKDGCHRVLNLQYQILKCDQKRVIINSLIEQEVQKTDVYPNKLKEFQFFH